MTGTNLQGTNVISMIVPTNHADTYATHDSFYGKGGWREVDTLAERNAIPEERRRIGMVVYVRETFKAYLLKNSISDAGWAPFNIDGEEYVTEDEMSAAIEEALEDYPTKAELQDALGEYATQQWVIDYIGDIDLTDYQKKTDNSLQTTDKTIVGAINELNAKPHINTYSKDEEDALLALKSDKATTYTKAEVDELLEDLPTPEDVYTKDETDALLEGKANVGDSYTKAEVDEIIENLPTPEDVYTKDETNELLEGKADANNVYTKEEIDEIVEDIPVSDSVYTKVETNALLAGKIDKLAELDTATVGDIVQYVGENGTYKQGYFYKYVGEQYLTFNPKGGAGSIEVEMDDFKALLATCCEGRTFTAEEVVSGQIGYHNLTDRYSFSATTADGHFFAISLLIADFQEAGVTFNPALGPQQGFEFTCNFSSTPWVRVDVQPQPNTYTKAQVNEMLSAKANVTDVTNIENRVESIEQGEVFVPTDEYEQKCAQYEADIAALQEENEALQTTVSTMQTTLDYVYEIVTQPHYDVLPDEEP